MPAAGVVVVTGGVVVVVVVVVVGLGLASPAIKKAESDLSLIHI